LLNNCRIDGHHQPFVSGPPKPAIIGATSSATRVVGRRGRPEDPLHHAVSDCRFGMAGRCGIDLAPRLSSQQQQQLSAYRAHFNRKSLRRSLFVIYAFGQ
jgi:hypothetical protein